MYIQIRGYAQPPECRLCCWVHGGILSASSLMCIAGNRRVRKRGRHLRISMENHGPVAILSRPVTHRVHLKIHIDGFSPCSQQKSRHDQQRQQVHQATISVHVVSSIASSRGEMQMRGRTNKISMDFAPAPPPPQFRPRSTATVLRHCSIIGGVPLLAGSRLKLQEKDFSRILYQNSWSLLGHTHR